MTREAELLDLISRPVSSSFRPKSWRGQNPWWKRQVYRGDKSRDWYLTYSAELPAYEAFSDADVDALRRAGRLVAAYPNTEAQDDVFIFAD